MGDEGTKTCGNQGTGKQRAGEPDGEPRPQESMRKRISSLILVTPTEVSKSKKGWSTWKGSGRDLHLSLIQSPQYLPELLVLPPRPLHVFLINPQIILLVEVC